MIIPDITKKELFEVIVAYCNNLKNQKIEGSLIKIDKNMVVEVRRHFL